MAERQTARLNLAWARQLVAGCAHAGVAGFCVSPGSRSAPLTLAVAEYAGAEKVQHFDERGAAFHALGWAHAARAPVALVCTSGTAAANYLPAIVEASQARVPLVVLSADRPPELADCGANQAILQPGLFHRHVRWEHTLPPPTPETSLRMAATAAAQACHMAVRPPAGPVHLNCMFREPLYPETGDTGETSGLEPPRSWYRTETNLAQPDQHALLNRLGRVERGLLLVGRLDSPEETAAARRLAKTLGWPVFADVASGLRLTAGEAPVVPHFDVLLSSQRFRDACRPDLLLRVGGRFVSKRLGSFLGDCAAPYLQVAGHPFRDDPAHGVTDRYECDVAGFCTWLAFAMRAAEPPAHTPDLLAAGNAAGEAVDAWIGENDALSEIAVARAVSRTRPPGTPLFLGNSMPVRDMDMFGVTDGPDGIVAANRGASGIDGNVAAAAGVARGAALPATALVGDLAALHDLNSLALLRKAPHPVTLVVINNNGGGIFHFLPATNLETVFEPWFGTPHGLQFEDAARMFGLGYACVRSRADFEQTYLDRTRGAESCLIEAVTDREANLREHRALQQRMVEAAETALG